MLFHETPLHGVFLIDIDRQVDERGFFARTFCRREFAAHGLHGNFVQCNISYNPLRGTLRGMHYQRPPHQESKLVRCTAGSIYEVVVDLRGGSPTFGRHFGVELSALSRTMVYIPVGFANGFLTLCDRTELCYQMGDYYQPDRCEGFRWNDTAVGIVWPMNVQVLSLRDATFEDVDLDRLGKLFDYRNEM